MQSATQIQPAADIDHRGPQITARPGTKRHARQCVARKLFFTIQAVTQAAETRRLQAKVDAIATAILMIEPAAGCA